MIQLSSVEDVRKVVKDWNEDSFSGSNARTTIKHDNNNNTGMVKGVPLDIEDEVIQQAFESKYAGSKIARLSREGQKLHTVKVKFNDEKSLSDAIQNGITIASCNMMFRINLPYSTTNNNNV